MDLYDPFELHDIRLWISSPADPTAAATFPSANATDTADAALAHAPQHDSTPACPIATGNILGW